MVPLLALSERVPVATLANFGPNFLIYFTVAVRDSNYKTSLVSIFVNLTFFLRKVSFKG